MGVPRSTLLLIPIVAALLLAPLALRLPNPYGSELLLELNETSHTVLFFLVQLALLHYLRTTRPDWRTIRLMFVTVGLCLVFGGAIELIQPLLRRSRSWEDMGRNLLGVVGACGVFLAVRGPAGWRSKLSLGLAVLVLVSSLLPLLNAFHRQTLRDRDFPLLMDFDRAETRSYVGRASHSKLLIEAAPKEWPDNSTQVARVTMPSAARWSGFVLRHPHPDWSKFGSLRFDVLSHHAEAVKIAVNIYSAENGTKILRYKSFTVAPGLNHFAMDLTKGVSLEQHHITSVSWYSVTKGQDLELFFDNLHLK
jgi:hypothetical protein